MMQFALIASGVAALSIGALVLVIRANRRKVAALENHVSQLQAMVESASDQIRKRDRTIEVLQEGNANAAHQIKEIRDKPTPRARADAATDKLRELSRGDRDSGSSSRD